MASINPTSIPSKRLSASITASTYTFSLNNILSWDGVTNLTAADFGTLAYGAFRNDTNTAIEFFAFDPSTIASASITILYRGLKFTGDTTTEVTANKLTWVKNQTIVEIGADVPQLLKHFVDDVSAQTVAGLKTFTTLPQSAATPSAASDLVTKTYADGLAISGSPNASATVKGIVQEATQAQVLSKTAAGSTGAELYVNPAMLASTLLSDYKVDTGAANAYVITPVPNLTAYTTGQIFSFKTVNANTTTSTLNVNALGAKTIKNITGGNLVANDILAGQVVFVEYDGTNMVMLSPLANTVSLSGGAYPAGDGSALTNVSASRTISSYTAGEAITAGDAVSMGYYQSGGQITFDNKLAISITGSTSYTTNFTVGANSNRILIIMITQQAQGIAIGSVQYAGQNLTTINNSGSRATYCGYIVAPATGTNSITFSCSGATLAYSVVAYSFYNAKQTGQPSASAMVNGTGSAATCTPAEDGCVVVGGVFNQSSGPTSSINQENTTSANFSSAGDTGVVVPAVAISESGQSGGGDGVAHIVAIAPVSASVDAVVRSRSVAGVYSNYKTTAFLGFANSSVSAGAAVNVTTSGIMPGMTSLTKFSNYYMNDAAGTIGTSAGTITKKVGLAVTATTLLITNIW